MNANGAVAPKLELKQVQCSRLGQAYRVSCFSMNTLKGSAR